MMLKIKSFTFNPFQENTFILYDETKSGVLIDPGCADLAERRELEEFVLDEGIQLTQLLNTHCHVDHVLGNAWAKRRYGLPLSIHQNEIPVLKSVEVYAPQYGFASYESTEADHFLVENQTLAIGKENIEVLFVPGHAPGHVVFYHKESKQCICGDTLFRGSIGRTDLPGGDHHLLLQKIREVLFALPDETILYPGHGPATTVGFEKQNNPFVGKNSIY
ncbi:MBL fold metallo-hydrolase [Algoriphagus namhaensis]